MTRHLTIAATGLAALAVAVSSTVISASGASAATTPPFESGKYKDVNDVGTLAFYSSTGALVRSGPLSQPLGAYAVGSGTLRAGDSVATLYAFTPRDSTNAGAFSGQQLSGTTSYPVSGAPSPVGSTTNPVVTESGTDTTLGTYVADNPSTATTSGDKDVYQLRLRTNSPGSSTGATYDAADVVVDTSAGTWTQVYPATQTAPATPSPTVSGRSRVATTDTCVVTVPSGDTATYAWLVSGKAVKGATRRTFTIPASAYKKSLSCAVELSNTAGHAAAVSRSVKVGLGAAVKNRTRPTLHSKNAHHAAKVGTKETVSHGSWSPTPRSYGYQWYAGSKKIKHATHASYTIAKKYAGKKLSCRVTAHATGRAAGTRATKSVTVKKK